GAEMKLFTTRTADLPLGSELTSGSATPAARPPLPLRLILLPSDLFQASTEKFFLIFSILKTYASTM
ncbi:MAG: hypothetical protein ACO2Y4_06865, partial [Burkholderiaceae bacterium]